MYLNLHILTHAQTVKSADSYNIPPSGLNLSDKTTYFSSIFNIDVQSWLKNQNTFCGFCGSLQNFWSAKFNLHPALMWQPAPCIVSTWKTCRHTIGSWITSLTCWLVQLIFSSNHTLSRPPALYSCRLHGHTGPLTHGPTPVSGIQTLICSSFWQHRHMGSLACHLT